MKFAVIGVSKKSRKLSRHILRDVNSLAEGRRILRKLKIAALKWWSGSRRERNKAYAMLTHLGISPDATWCDDFFVVSQD